MRLRRAEGQLRGVQRMLEEGSDCQQVLTQLAAVKAAGRPGGAPPDLGALRSCMADGEGDCAEAFEDAVATFLRFASLAK